MNKNKNFGAIIFVPAYYLSKGLSWLMNKCKLTYILALGCSVFFIYLFFTGIPYSSKWSVIGTIMVLVPVYILVIGSILSVIPLVFDILQLILSPFVTLYNHFTEDIQPSEEK